MSSSPALGDTGVPDGRLFMTLPARVLSVSCHTRVRILDPGNNAIGSGPDNTHCSAVHCPGSHLRVQLARLTSPALIARERERDTLVSLVSTPLMPKEILRQKFLGGLWSLRGGFYWLLMIGSSAVVAGFYPVWAFAILLFMYCVWSIPLATFGLVGSSAAPTTQKSPRQRPASGSSPGLSSPLQSVCRLLGQPAF